MRVLRLLLGAAIALGTFSLASAAFTTSPNSATFGPTVSTTGLSVGSSHNLFFEVNYLTPTATVEITGFGGGPLITTASITGASFSGVFGANTGGAFGLVGFDSEGALIDNLLVIDYTQFPPAPEPGSWLLLGGGTLGLCQLRKRRVRRAEQTPALAKLTEDR